MTTTKQITIAGKCMNVQTNVNKSFHGWLAESTFFDLREGKDYKVTTMKRSSGNISTCFQAGKHETRSTGFSSFSYMMFQDHNGTVQTIKKNATEKAITEAHEAGVNLFINHINTL